jgi:MFS family permease
MSEPREDPAAASEEAHPTWVRWRIVALLMAYSFMSWFNRVAIPVAEDPLTKEFGFQGPMIGALDTTLLLAYTLAMTPGGWFIDRFGPRRALIALGFGTALFVALTGVAGYGLIGLVGLAFATFLLIRALMGVFSAPIYPASAKLVAHWIPFSRRAWANGLINGAAPLGMAAAQVLFALLIDQAGWRMAFGITGGVTALLALIWTAYARDDPKLHRSVNRAELRLLEKDQGPSASDVGGAVIREAADLPPADPTPFRVSTAAAGTSWVSLLKNRSLVLLTLSYAAVGYFEYLLNFCTKAYFRNVLEMTEEATRSYASASSLAQVVGMPLGGWLSDLCVRRYGTRLGRALVPAIGMLGSATALFAATMARDPDWTLLWFALANAAIGATEGAFWTTAIELGGRRGGTSAGILNTGGNAGGSLAPLVTRSVASVVDWRWGLYLSSLVCLAGVCTWRWIDPGERAPD